MVHWGERRTRADSCSSGAQPSRIELFVTNPLAAQVLDDDQRVAAWGRRARGAEAEHEPGHS